MEIIEDVIVEAIGLGVDGIKFYRDRKVSDKAVTKFDVTVKERKHLVKISKTCFSPSSISHP